MAQNRRKARPDAATSALCRVARRRTALRFALLPLAAALFLILSAPLRAQEDEPPVVIDLSVLNSMDPSAAAPRPTSPQQPLQRRSLTAVVPANKVSTPPPEDILSYSRRKTTPQRPVSFPVTIQGRSDDIDPSLQTTAKGAKQAARKQTKSMHLDTALPELSPVPVAVRKHPPPPPPPPRRAAATPAAEEVLAVRPDSLRSDGRRMPAVPAKKVVAETLPPLPGAAVAETAPEQDTDLASGLMVPDRHSLAENLDTMMAKRSPDTKPPALPPAVAEHKPPQKTPSPEKLVAAKAAAIEPAAGFQTVAASTLPKIPRTPPEEDHELEYVSLPFTTGAAALDEKNTSFIDSRIAPLLRENPTWRLQIQAFAAQEDRKGTDARRTSLSRALAVRSRLLDKGIDPQRMDVRALGMETDRDPVDRVDFVFYDAAKGAP